MSDNVSLTEQTTCVDSESEDAWYTIDIFSHVQLELDEGNESHKQLFLYVTRAGGNRRTFLQVHNFLRDLGWDNVAEFAPLLLSTSSGVVSNRTIKSYDHAGCANDRVTEKMASLDGKAKAMHWSFYYIVSKSLFVTHGC